MDVPVPIFLAVLTLPLFSVKLILLIWLCFGVRALLLIISGLEVDIDSGVTPRSHFYALLEEAYLWQFYKIVVGGGEVSGLGANQVLIGGLELL